jgi:hypothetical protein
MAPIAGWGRSIFIRQTYAGAGVGPNEKRRALGRAVLRVREA